MLNSFDIRKLKNKNQAIEKQIITEQYYGHEPVVTITNPPDFQIKFIP